MNSTYNGGFTQDEMYRAEIYGQKHPGTVKFLMAQARQDTSAYISHAAQTVIQSTANALSFFDQNRAVRLAKAVVRTMENAFVPDLIMQLNTVSQLQHAPTVMQPFLMAEPTLRQLYQNNGCEGYSDTYYNTQPNAIGFDHKDYRSATQDAFMQHDGFDRPMAVTYVEVLSNDYQTLSVIEKAEIMASWGTMRSALLARMDDPTSRWNDKL